MADNKATEKLIEAINNLADVVANQTKCLTKYAKRYGMKSLKLTAQVMLIWTEWIAMAAASWAVMYILGNALWRVI